MGATKPKETQVNEIFEVLQKYLRKGLVFRYL